jgi:hypothetical protein
MRFGVQQPGNQIYEVWMIERKNALESPRGETDPARNELEASSHPAWISFVRYCREMGYGEIERLKIQDGIPVLAEVTRQKIKFS